MHLALEMMSAFSFCGRWPYPKENKGLGSGIDDRKAGQELQDHPALVCRFSSCETHLRALFKCSIVCVYVCVCITCVPRQPLCVCIHAHMHIHVCTHVWKPEEKSQLLFCFPSTVYPLPSFLKVRSLLLSRRGWPASEPSRVTCFHVLKCTPHLLF